MSTVKTVSEITDRREIQMRGLTWRVVEFNSGSSYMLFAETPALSQFSVHFTREQWNEFQSLVQR